MRRVFFSVLFFGSLFLSGLLCSFQVKAQELKEVRVYVFHSAACPHCKSEMKFLNKIESDYPNLEIKSMLIEEKSNQLIFRKVVDKFNLSGGVPTIVIGDKPIVGFNSEKGIGKTIKNRIKECSTQACNSFLDQELGLKPIVANSSNVNIEESEEVKNHSTHKTIQVFGKELCLEKNGSLCFLGGVLGLADGVNPCMFSVLMFLLVYLIGIGSSRKALKAGIAFVITTFLFYLFFMFGLIKIISVLQIAREVRIAISAFALVVGLVMIKDYFFYGKWFSFEISKKTKPMLEKLTKKGTVTSAIILALLASLVELPCTSGIPLAYVSILSTKEVFAFGYLILYNIFFVLPLLIIVFGTIFVWKKVEKVEEWREKSKKYMRLVAGILLILLSIAIWNNWL
jgi:cytochrome c biogenesis protein CcdA/glutaredoxin